MRGLLSHTREKNHIAEKIIEILLEHTTYDEPFAGGAEAHVTCQANERW